jgi:hypothetical protein
MCKNTETYVFIVNATIFFPDTQIFLLNVKAAWQQSDYSIILSSYSCPILYQEDDIMTLAASRVG